MPNRTTADPFRMVPERRPEFAHLSLDGLRTYRSTLTTEEGRVSYWRRILQARLDMVRSTALGAPANVEALQSLFADDQFGAGRTALVSILSVDDMPPLPDLVSLWSREPRPGEANHNRRLAHDLTAAEAQLSAYRTALHERLAAATNELIARYRENPQLCLSALPVPGGGSPRAERV